eukprot:gb/GEZN01007691.1/.p1 GENE.gb/GEZN01007691.1/~~gb/GEZN01007691.1/.p1  ORF type:complete len:471 (-),score=109.21 gb/GEZN01007691.1/:102-1424(-)
MSPSDFKRVPAPGPNDLEWAYLDTGELSREVRGILVNVAVFCLVFFWTVPIGFISALTSLDSLTHNFPSLDVFLTRNPMASAWLQGVLPSLDLVIFMAVLPTLFYEIVGFKRLATKSAVMLDVLRYYFLFNVFNVFLVFTLSGSIMTELKEVIKAPTTIPELLARALPKQALFFLNFILLRTFTTWPLQLLRTWPLILHGWRKLTARVPEEIEMLEMEDEKLSWGFDYATCYSIDLLVFTIAFSFAVMTPLILPAALLYFLVAWVATKHELTQVWKPHMQLGGDYWPVIFNRLVAGVMVAQLTLVGYFSVKDGYYQAGAIVVLCFLLLRFWYYVNQIFPAAQYLPLGALQLAPKVTVPSSSFTSPSSFRSSLSSSSGISATDSPKEDEILTTWRREAEDLASRAGLSLPLHPYSPPPLLRLTAADSPLLLVPSPRVSSPR